MKTVLIADDNADFVDTQAALLSTDYDVARAYSVQQALDILDQREDIAAIVSDIRMPGYDGYDLLRVMRHRWPKIPVLLVTGFPLDEAALPRGAVVLQKPCEPDTLRREIAAALARREGHGPSMDAGRRVGGSG